MQSIRASTSPPNIFQPCPMSEEDEEGERKDKKKRR
jgi:hypothetical protein